MNKSLPVIFIIGPTGVGKSLLAIELAHIFNGEIINLDAFQIYKELNIGVGKPPLEWSTQIPHHLFDIVSIAEDYDVFRYSQLAIQKIKEIQQKEKSPIFCGGTGLYLKSLIFGLFHSSMPISEDIKTVIQKMSLEERWSILKKVDSELCSRISINDHQRIFRGVEIFMSQGVPLSILQKQNKTKTLPSYILIGLQDLSRDQLYQKINQRVLLMLEEGLEQEANVLWKRFPHNKVLARTIGYKEWQTWFTNKQKYPLELIQQNQRNLAKKQLTLFRSISNIKWFTLNEKEQIINYIHSYLKEEQRKPRPTI